MKNEVNRAFMAKKKILFIALMSVITLGAFARGKQPMTFAKLPQKVQDTVLVNFSEDQIQLITSEKTMPKHYKYVLHMADGTKLECNNKAQLRKVSNKNGIKEAFVPEIILTYVHETFPNATITEYKRETMKQEIELNNKMDLVFNTKGKFLRIDD
jgi:hypothetical protein